MVEFDALMQPIKPDHPSGDDLRLDSGDTTFAQLDEMRLEIDPAIDPSGNAKSADWSAVVSLSSEVLSTRTKDLELAAILTQGLVVEEGFQGLLTGLRLIRGLITDFWETVHPGWDDGEIIEPIRARPLSWLGSSKDLLLAIKRVSLSAPIGAASHSWFEYEQSKRVDQAAIKADQGP
ncbi:MAG: type VI secretion system ImpA family N-terminal domain-containing protein, partial [Anaerolineales bacterium]|nr:type VI secretion system ImpA family N-terminal domain-containing protein [Anaerolineales bacterium]